MALSAGKTKKIERLLQEGILSKRAISRQENVSRITIDKIEKKLLFPQELALTSQEKTFVRCKGCGGMVLDSIPCIKCQLQRSQLEGYNTFMESLLSPEKAQVKKNGKPRRQTKKKAGRSS